MAEPTGQVFRPVNNYVWDTSLLAWVPEEPILPGAANIVVSAGTTSGNLSRVVFQNGNGVTFGLDGSTITASVAGGGAGDGYNILAAGTQTANTTGTVLFSNLNGITFGMANSSVITASYTVPSTAGLLSAINFSAGTTSNNSSAFVFSNSNGFSFGLNNGTITGSYTVPSTAGLLSAVNVSAGTTSNNLSNMVFGNANGFSFGLNGSTVTGSYTVPTVTNSSLTLSDGVTSMTLARLAFTNSNGLTLSLSTAAGGSATLVGSYTVPSTAGLISAINMSAGTTSSNATNFVFADANGMSFGMNGRTITGSYTVPTVPAQFSVGLTNAGNTAGDTGLVTGRLVLVGGNNVTVSGSTNGGSMTVTISAAAGGGGGNTGSISAGTTRGTLGEVVFSDSNGISFGINGQTLTASHNGLTSQSNQAVSGSNGSFTFQTVMFGNLNNFSFYTSNGSLVGSYTVPTVTNSSWTVSDNGTSGTVGRLAFTNLNGVTLSLSTGANGSHTIVGSHNGLTSQSNQAFSAAGGSSAFQTLGFSDNAHLSWSNSNGSVVAAPIKASIFAASNTTQSSSGTAFLSSLIFAGAGLASVGVTNGSVVVSVPAGAPSPVNFSAGTTSGNLDSVVFSNSNGVTFGLNGSTITASVAAAGGGVTLSGYNPYPDRVYVTGQSGNGTLGFDPMAIGGAFQCDRILFPIHNSNSSNSSGSHTLSFWVGIYTRTNSSLSLLTSTSSSTAITHSGTAGSYSLFSSGPRLFSIPFTTTISGGNYWLAFLSSTASAGANGSYSNWVVSGNASAFIGNFGVSTNATRQFTLGQGIYTTTVNSMPGSVAFSQIQGTGTIASRPAIVMFASDTV